MRRKGKREGAKPLRFLAVFPILLEREIVLAELRHLSDDDRVLVARLIEMAERVSASQTPICADFLDPRQRGIAGREVAAVPEVRCLYYGGYHRAERQRLVLLPEAYPIEAADPQLAFLEIAAEGTVKLAHADYLGALLNLGVKREKLGDLIVLSGKGQIVAAAEIQPFIMAGLQRVGRTRVTVTAIEPEQLQVPPEREKEIRTTVASLRLDAVAADGFGASRTRMAREIKAGRVRVNWQVSLNADKLLQPGDVLSIRGQGRVIVAAVDGPTKKGRWGLVLKVQK